MHDWDLKSCWYDLFAYYITFLTFTATRNDSMYTAKISMFPPLTVRKTAGKKESAELSQHSFDPKAKRDDYLRYTLETS